MKDTLGEVQSKIKELKSDEVLILVLMEDTLGDSKNPLLPCLLQVLILVLMEDTLGDAINNRFLNLRASS